MSKTRQAAKEGLFRGLRSYLWLMKIVVPVSAAVALIEYSGWLFYLDPVLSPVLGLLGFSASAVIPLLVGLLAGIYAGIAAMTALSLSPVDQILITVFILISHNLIQEGIIQDRSGLSFWKATIIRLLASITTVMVLAWLLNSSPSENLPEAANFIREPFSKFAVVWTSSIVGLAVKMFAILMPLMVLLEIMKITGGIDVIVRVIAPLLRIMGLKRKVGFLWLTGAVFGLSYGAAVIVEEAQNGSFSGRDLEELHVSVGINHAMIEDPLLFMAIGIPPLWLWLPRLVAAFAAVYLLRVIEAMPGRIMNVFNKSFFC